MADFKEMRLPIEITDKMVGGPMWNTRIFGVQSGDESRLGLWAYPLHKWDISEAGRELSTAQATKIIHMRARGQLYGFRALDPLDFTVYTGQGKLIATATAGVYQLVKVYTMDGDTFVRPILKPIPAQCAVIDNTGALVTGDPIDYTTGLVTLTGSSATITSGYSWLGMFDVPVRFTDDWLQVGKDTGLLAWKNAHIKEIRRTLASTGTPPTLLVNWDFGPVPLYYAPSVPTAPTPAPAPPPPAPAPAPVPTPAPAPSNALTNGTPKTLHYSDGVLQQFTYAHGSGVVHLDGAGSVGPGYFFYKVSGPPDFFGGSYDGYITTATPGDTPSIAAGTLYIQAYFGSGADLVITVSGP